MGIQLLSWYTNRYIVRNTNMLHKPGHTLRSNGTHYIVNRFYCTLHHIIIVIVICVFYKPGHSRWSDGTHSPATAYCLPMLLLLPRGTFVSYICVGLFEPRCHIFEVYIFIFVVNSELYGPGCVCHNFKLSDVPSCLHLCPRLHISIRPAPGISCHHIFHRWMFVSSHNILPWES